MTLYLGLVWLTGITAFGMAYYGYRTSRDTLHPLLFLGPMLAFSYSLTPLVLVAEGDIWLWLPVDDMDLVQFYYFLGVLSLSLGVLAAGSPRKLRRQPWMPSPQMRRQLRKAGLVLGGLGVAAFVYMVRNAGGLDGAYGEAHGHGWAASGYVREAFFWIIPGLLLLLMANSGRRICRTDKAWIALIAAPLLIHGLLSAARGPTFMILITLVVGWYMVRYRRPMLIVMVAGLGGLGLLVLFLVTHRGMLHLGSEGFEFGGFEAILDFVGRASGGSEYIFGSATVIDASVTGEYQWGARYIIQTVIRAIPRQIWPTQYEDAFRFFGIEGISSEIVGDFSRSLGWVTTGGSSMGMLGDMWKQLWWLSLGLLFAIGWFYGRAWRRAVEVGGIWIMVYVVLVALSIFLTQQTFQAMLFRLMFLGGGGWIVWRLFIRKAWKQMSHPAQPTKSSEFSWHPHQGPYNRPRQP